MAIEAGCGKDRHVRDSSGFHSWLETHLSLYAARLDGSRPGEARLWVTVAESPEHMRELCLLYRLRVEQSAAIARRKDIITQMPVAMFLCQFPTAVAKRVLKGILARVTPSSSFLEDTEGWRTWTMKTASSAVDVATSMTAHFTDVQCKTISKYISK